MKAMLQYTALPISLADGTRPDALTQGTGELNAEGSVRLAWLSVAMWANPATVTQYPQILATSTTIADTRLGLGRTHHLGSGSRSAGQRSR